MRVERRIKYLNHTVFMLKLFKALPITSVELICLRKSLANRISKKEKTYINERSEITPQKSSNVWFSLLSPWWWLGTNISKRKWINCDLIHRISTFINTPVLLHVLVANKWTWFLEAPKIRPNFFKNDS